MAVHRALRNYNDELEEAGVVTAALTPEQAEKAMKDLPRMSINEIARLVAKDWERVNFAARPYLDAMFSMDKISDPYGADSGESIVAYFLGNATSWRGDMAKAVKKELNRRLK